ncbi:MAG: AsmA family protein, partial [Tistlia sp.]
MRTLLIVAGALLALLVLVVLFGPLLVDWNAFKPRLAAAVEEATGRSLQIEGDLRLSVLPTPTLSAEGARLSNVEGGSQPTMVSLETLEVRVALTPLLGGDLQVRSLVLVEPTILLERLADGRVNWDLSPPHGAAPGTSSPTSLSDEPVPEGESEPGHATPLSVTLDRVTIRDGTLVYRDAPAGTEERLEALDAILTAGSLRGPFQVEGEARLRGTPLELSLSTGRLALGGATAVTINLALPDAGDAKARFNGELTAGEAASARGNLTLSGESLLALAALAAPGTELPGSLAQPFNLSGRLDYRDARLSLESLDLSMADTAVAGAPGGTFG